MSGGGGGGHGYFGGSEMNGWNTDNGFLGSGGDDYFDGGAGEDQMWGYNGNDTLYLGAGNEGAYGGNGRDKVWGGAGNDAVFGQNGDDTVWGGTEHDWVAGGSGHDQLLGDDGNLTYGGNDTMEGDAGNDTMWGEAGHDLMYGDIGLTNGTSKPYNPDRNDQSMNGAEYYNRNALDNNDLMWGGSGNDAMYGQEGNDTLYGEVGDDYLDGGVSADTMSGGSGNDSYVVDNVGDLVTELANEGIDTVRTSLNNYTLAANVENMTLLNGAIKAQGNTANNIIYGTAVANDINGAAGNDTLYGYGGDDTLDGGVGNDTMDGGAGNNTYAIDNSKDRVIQSLIDASNKVLLNIASDNDPALQALDPNDKAAITKLLMGRDLTAAELANVTVNFSGPDRWTGTEGNDTRTDLSDRDSLYKGLGGDDTLNGGGGNDTLEGGQGNDSLNGGTGTDSLDGGEGADTLVGGTGNDTMRGGTGNDLYFIDNNLDFAIEEANQGEDKVISSIDYAMAVNIENLDLVEGSQAKIGIGNELDNSITGNSGDNSLDGGAGNDILNGGAGNDTLDGGTGADTMDGGLGNNTFNIDSLDDKVIKGTINLDNKVVLNISTSNDPRLAQFVNESINDKLTFVGRFFNTNLFTGDELRNITINWIGDITGNYEGTDGNDSFTDSTGKDSVINGLGGNDSLNGGGGNDTIDGGIGNDTLIGDLGNDSLNGGTGADDLSGGAGNDTLDGTDGTASDTLRGGLGDDVYFLDGTSTATDTIVENSNEGTDTVIASVDYAMADNLENMELKEGSQAIIGIGNSANNRITGNGAANQLFGGGGNDTLDGGGGNDTLDGGTGADTMDGGLGNNTYVIDNVNDRVIQGQIDANNKVTLRIDASVNFSGKNDDEIKKLLLNNNGLTAEQLAQIKLEFAGDRVIDLGDGDNSFTDVEDRNSSISGGGGNDTIDGAGGNDTIDGGTGNDSLIGGAGNDILIGGAGNDTLVGGVGDDVYVVDSDGDLVTELLNQGKDTVQSYSQFYQLGANIENLTLMNGAIYGFGNELANTITGNAADNYLNGGGGNDTLVGGSGNDTLEGGSGADSMDGGSGNNTYIIDQAGDRFFQSTIDANNTVTLNVDAFIGFNPDLTDSQIIQALSGSALSADQLKFITLKFQGDTNFQGNDDINNGDNFRDTGRANSFLSGRKGNDTLDGAAGNDTVKGDEGNDVLIGGKGNDDLYGGNGADVFRWEGSDVNLSQLDISYADVIKDFNAGGLQISTKTGSEADTLDLSGLLARLGYDASSSNANLNTLSNFLKVENSASNTVFSVDLDGVGSGTALQTITLEGTRLSSLDLAELQSRGVLHA